MLTAIFVIYTILELFMIKKTWKNKKPIAIQSIGIYFCFLALLAAIKIFNLMIPDYATILIILSGIGHIFVGEFLNYYNKSIRYDRYLHALGCFSFSVFSYYFILSFINPAVNSRILTGIFVFTIGLSYGVIFEILEFIIDCKSRKKKENTKRAQRGLIDTDFDMVFDIIGSFAAAIFSFFVLY